MVWSLVGTIDLNDSDWKYSSVFPSESSFLKFTESLTIQGTPVPPENVKLRALFAVSQGSDEITESRIIYPSNKQIVYPVPLQPFFNPQVALKLLGTGYLKFSPQWTFEIYSWV